METVEGLLLMLENIWAFYCDNGGCEEVFDDAWSSKTLMIKNARAFGWSIGKRHLCPDCRNRAVVEGD